MLTSENGKDKGFELGANDYLKKPFGMKELMVRIRALAGKMRTAVHKEESIQTHTIGDYTFYPDRQIRIVNVRGEGYLLIIDQNHIPIS